MTIPIREFTRNIYEYLKEGEYVVTKQGKPEFVVTIKKVDGVIKQEETSSAKFLNTKEEISSALTRNFTTYGCGCSRGKSKTCDEHGRY